MARDNRDPQYLGAALLYARIKDPTKGICEHADNLEEDSSFINYGETREQYIERNGSAVTSKIA